ncbi:MAG: ABC transporter ATP-binding protein [Nitrososphaerales archaeon]|nr:ABC transporter ATP-binding protein [Nitrososphaerales archaeon]
MQDNNQVLVEVKGLIKYFPVYSRGVLLKRRVGSVHAVDNVSFQIRKGETLALVGESGCGKTTTAKCILDLEHADEGDVLFNGQSIYGSLRSGRERRMAVRRKMQYIFQNPFASLDPRMTVYDILLEPLEVHRHLPKKEWGERVYALLKLVGLEEYHAERYPHEFSGGQRQRICIARALAVDPDFVIADEPVSSLDVSIRAQILNLLGDLKEEKGLTYLYISHDLASVRQISDRVAVMYLGEIVEIAATDEIFDRPLHPYTQALISAVPIPDPDKKTKRIILSGEVPSPISPPRACRFHPRCLYATDICRTEAPPLIEAKKDHWVSCHWWQKFA